MEAMSFVAMWHQASAGKSRVGRRTMVYHSASHQDKPISMEAAHSLQFILSGAADGQSEVGWRRFRLGSLEAH